MPVEEKVRQAARIETRFSSTGEAHRRSRDVLEAMFGPPHERSFDVRFWDGTIDHGQGTAPFALHLNTPYALRRMLVPPTELSISEALIRGDIEVPGDLEAAVSLSDIIGHRIQTRKAMANLARLVMALPRDRKDDLAERQFSSSARALGPRHDPERDAAAVKFHYDIGNDFYKLFLDERMVYSSAYFDDWSNVGSDTLDAAQEAKLDLICRKLRLQPGERLLDIGCGWGALIIHAATYYGVTATGITLSEEQAQLARERIWQASLSNRCSVDIRDYRTLGTGAEPEEYDKISSVGMVEHVGEAKLAEYFESAYRVLKSRGLFLNHGIVSLSDPRPITVRERAFRKLWRADAFIDKYVFPDGKLYALHKVISAAERMGFETRDVESLREHYARTLRLWVRRLEAHKDEAIRLVGEQTYRVWRLYMSGSARAFATAAIGIDQTVFAKPDRAGSVLIPPTRDYLEPY
ncbi:MAG TPA: cyclopropane-fatty-acyl-phospholipid synthase family protein [Gemmatimonadaceae bacterium]|nr:cyclopropane-fatty-acyl-phospholipid synthase family protein [Gemmatimonadaceae bacterium]